MQHLYIDESGSMTAEHIDQWPFFTIAIVTSENKDHAKRVVKRFIAKHLEELRTSDSLQKMFSGSKFLELKGTYMSPDLQTEFIRYMCQKETVKIFLIRVSNAKIQYGLYDNTARAFNYILGQALYQMLKKGILPKDSYMLHIDERNQRTGTTHALEDYLNIQLCMDHQLTGEITVRYYDSAQNSLIQVADVFSNAYYKHCKSRGKAGGISAELNRKLKEGYFQAVYKFPEKILETTQGNN